MVFIIMTEIHDLKTKSNFGLLLNLMMLNSSNLKKKLWASIPCGRQGGFMVSALDSGASSLGSSLGQGHCVVFLDKTFYSHSASLHPGVQMATCELLDKPNKITGE